MKSLLFSLSFITACFAQSLDVSVGTGGPHPAMTFPNVMGFNALSGKYKHVVILTIDGFHHVRYLISRQ